MAAFRSLLLTKAESYFMTSGSSSGRLEVDGKLVLTAPGMYGAVLPVIVPPGPTAY